jgi:hypothetical protein
MHLTVTRWCRAMSIWASANPCCFQECEGAELRPEEPDATGPRARQLRAESVPAFSPPPPACGSHRRCDPGEGVQVHQLTSSSRREPLTRPSPRKRGEGDQAKRIMPWGGCGHKAIIGPNISAAVSLSSMPTRNFALCRPREIARDPPYLLRASMAPAGAPHLRSLSPRHKKESA